MNNFEDDDILYVSPEGYCRGSLAPKSDLLYIALTESGEQKLFTPAQFESEYGWKNDPAKVPPPKRPRQSAPAKVKVPLSELASETNAEPQPPSTITDIAPTIIVTLWCNGSMGLSPHGCHQGR